MNKERICKKVTVVLILSSLILNSCSFDNDLIKKEPNEINGLAEEKRATNLTTDPLIVNDFPYEVESNVIAPFQLGGKAINPYLSFTFNRYFRNHFRYGGEYRLFMPLIQNQDQILFWDLRLYETNRLEFNSHFGFRYGKDLKNLWGLYLGFDYRQGQLSNYQQLVFGGEIWYQSWFIGGNYYQPFFKTKRVVNGEQTFYETVLSGGDLTLAKEFNSKWSIWLTGYHFQRKREYLTGGRGRIEYKWFNRYTPVTFSSEIQKDRRGWQFNLGLQLKLGHFNNDGNHGGELIRRDPDIILIARNGEILVDNQASFHTQQNVETQKL